MMKFETARAMHTIQTLTELPVQESDAGISQAEFLAESLESSEWNVQSGEITGSASASTVRSMLTLLGLFAGSAVILGLFQFRAHWPWFVLVMGMVVGWILLLEWANPRRLRLMPPLRKTRLVIARRPTSVEAPSRLVIQTALGPIVGKLGMSPKEFRRLNLTVGIMAPLFVVAWHIGANTYPDAWPRPATLAMGASVLAWILFPFAVLRSMRQIQAKAMGGSSDGPALALLLELARTWSENRSAGLETVLIAVGGQDYDHAGDEALRRIAADWPRKPTLIISLAAPGLGSTLLIEDFEAEGLVTRAAKNLWIPHRRARASELPGKLWPLRGVTEGKVVWLAGDWFDEPRPQVDPDALARTAQLIDEVALLWAKGHPVHSSHGAEERTPSRSSQNPG
jgi:hypothetical protein